MSQSSYIVCPHCQATNRVMADKVGSETGKCGKCGERLFDGQAHEMTSAQLIKQLEVSDQLVLVDYWASWCGPCQMMAPMFAETAAKMPQVRFVKLNTETEQALAGQHGIRSIPTLILFKDAKEVGRRAGVMQPDQLVQWLQAHGA